MKKFCKIILIIVICIALFPYSSQAITLGEYEKKLQEFIDEANANQAAINRTEAEIRETNNQIANIKTEMQNLTEEIEVLNQEIADGNEEIKEKSLQTKQLFQYLQMSNGENVYLEYAFGAETITDLIYRMAIVEQITEYNNKITKEIEAMIERNKQREKEIEQKKKELNNKQKSLEQRLVTLGNTKQSLTVGGTTIQEEVENYQAIVKMYKDQGCQSHHVIGVDCATYGSAGIFRRPVSWGYITSEFGYRSGTFHRAVDISNGDPYNTKIYPVANGIITKIYKDVYGALVVTIEHYDATTGQYYSSLYAHLSSWSPDIKTGMYVTSDTYIGYMGNSGYSFGAHLHLEIAQCRMYVDSACYGWNDYVNFMSYQANLGYKGPRQLINFPSGTYNAWYTR